jgi:hypothetical protein
MPDIAKARTCLEAKGQLKTGQAFGGAFDAGRGQICTD